MGSQRLDAWEESGTLEVTEVVRLAVGDERQRSDRNCKVDGHLTAKVRNESWSGAKGERMESVLNALMFEMLLDGQMC